MKFVRDRLVIRSFSGTISFELRKGLDDTSGKNCSQQWLFNWPWGSDDNSGGKKPGTVK
jgi:hypothetical protein